MRVIFTLLIFLCALTTWSQGYDLRRYRTSRIEGSAPETDGKLDVFVQSIGTGGSVAGIAKVLKKEIPNLKVIGIQPASSKEPWHVGMDFPSTPIKGGIVSQMLKADGLIDELVMVTDTIAREMTHRLWLEEGVYCGVSSGANVHFALEEIKKAPGKKLRVVTLMCDHMNRYLTDERYVT